MKIRILCLAALLVAASSVLLGCSDADKADTGGVSLVVSSFDGLPLRVGANATGGVVAVDEIVLASVVQNPSNGVGNLQTIEMKSYEVVYTRADAGSRVPPPLVQGLFGTVEPGSVTAYDNLPVMLGEQLLNPPLSDLLFVNGGFDRETGSSVIKLNLRMRFFGRTLGGREVSTSPQTFTVEFVAQ